MKSLIQSTFGPISESLYSQAPGQRVLMYHSITHTPKTWFDVSLNSFQEQIQWLKFQNEFEIMSCHESPKPNTKSIALSFDDGYQDNFTLAAPILVKLEIPFTVFVVSDFVKEKRRGYLVPNELRELSKLPGCSIGFHGKSHRPLVNLKAKDLEIEITDGVKILHDLLGHSVDLMSFPHGSFNQKVIEIANRNNLKKLFCSFMGFNQPDSNPNYLNRLEINLPDQLHDFQAKLRGSQNWRKGIQFIRQSFRFF